MIFIAIWVRWLCLLTLISTTLQVSLSRLYLLFETSGVTAGRQGPGQSAPPPPTEPSGKIDHTDRKKQGIVKKRKRRGKGKKGRRKGKERRNRKVKRRGGKKRRKEKERSKRERKKEGKMFFQKNTKSIKSTKMTTMQFTNGSKVIFWGGYPPQPNFFLPPPPPGNSPLLRPCLKPMPGISVLFPSFQTHWT